MNNLMPLRRFASLIALSIAPVLLATLAPSPAYAADACKHRGDLDLLYCDADRDMTADAPTDPKKLKNPAALMLSYSPQEDSVVYEKLWTPYVDHLKACVGKPVRFLPVYSSAATVEALRSGRIQLSLLSAGDTPFAVNIGGAVPIAIHGTAKDGIAAYHLVVVVRKDSPYKTLADLKGKRVAHVSPSSNSGNLAPRALFPKEGLVPDKDYKVLYSGKHDNSVSGVVNGDYDAGAIADDVLIRMIQRGALKPDDVRIIFTSKPFPAGSLAVAHDLDPQLKKKIVDCTFTFRFPSELSAAFRGPDRFVPLDYKRDYESVRNVATGSGESLNRAGFDARKARELEQDKKKAFEAAKK
ncbi:MAG: phosphate/phosphite/phosphonate ABC transporter substrate-binding protein [Usitatibacteraceae bacterium]